MNNKHIVFIYVNAELFVQVHERARQGRLRAKLMRDIRKALLFGIVMVGDDVDDVQEAKNN